MIKIFEFSIPDFTTVVTFLWKFLAKGCHVAAFPLSFRNILEPNDIRCSYFHRLNMRLLLIENFATVVFVHRIRKKAEKNDHVDKTAYKIYRQWERLDVAVCLIPVLKSFLRRHVIYRNIIRLDAWSFDAIFQECMLQKFYFSNDLSNATNEKSDITRSIEPANFTDLVLADIVVRYYVLSFARLREKLGLIFF